MPSCNLFTPPHQVV